METYERPVVIVTYSIEELRIEAVTCVSYFRPS